VKNLPSHFFLRFEYAPVPMYVGKLKYIILFKVDNHSGVAEKLEL